MRITRNLILAAAATAGIAAVSLPATASADCYHRDGDRAAGTIVGAVIGGGIGSALARGPSRGAGTVAGALVGGAIGNSVADDRNCYYDGGRYNRSGYAYYDDGYYDGDYGGPTVYVAPGPYAYHYYRPGYRYYYGRHYYRPYGYRRW